MDGSNLAQVAVTALTSAAVSVVTTIAVFRSRLDVMAAERKADKELVAEKLSQMARDVGRIAEEGRARFNMQERLSRAILELVANLASKEGADQRRHTTDVLTRFMAEEQEK